MQTIVTFLLFSRLQKLKAGNFESKGKRKQSSKNKQFSWRGDIQFQLLLQGHLEVEKKTAINKIKLK